MRCQGLPDFVQGFILAADCAQTASKDSLTSVMMDTLRCRALIPSPLHVNVD